jgi:alcohol dehydrogenase, propanol-preferring
VTVECLRLEQPAPIDSSPLRTATVVDPEPAADEVVVAVSACGVCRTDLQLCEGDLQPRRLPIVPGHQVVGQVVAMGRSVTHRSIGQRVGVAWIAGTCERCRFCTTGRENLCERSTFTGWDRDGGYATQVVARADFVHPLPAAFDDLDAAPLLCGGVIGYRSMRVAGVEPGMRVGLYGFGASATSVIQVAKHWGCEVHVATRSRREQERALGLGAAWAGGYDERPPQPLDAAITFAPAGSVVVAALSALDRGAVVAINAIHLDEVPAFPYHLLWWERQVRSVANVTRRDVTEFLELAAAIPVQSHYEVYELSEANLALQRLKRGEVSGSAVLQVT